MKIGEAQYRNTTTAFVYRNFTSQTLSASRSRNSLARKPFLQLRQRRVADHDQDSNKNSETGSVGRTGSGKSTLIQAIFRLVEPAQGQIMIDGVHISKIGLQDLRSKLSIIPQDPTLFQGTVRNNLDPLQQHNDHEIWEVLRKCHLADMVKQDQRLLDAPVSEEGQNWSLGLRQLVCLARILLHKRKILVLDEATASIDTATDNIIQKAVRSETEKCTVITVAHRITTILDSDLVLVLDDGNAIECSAPAQLLRDSSSAFSKLVKEFCMTSSN